MKQFSRNDLKDDMLMTVIRVSSFGSVRFARGYGVNQGCKNPSSNNTELNKMAKGENLEKPKKGGMVIVIGVGAKPKKDKTAMKKAEGRRAPRRRGSVQDNQRGRIHAFKQKLRSNPYHLEEVLEQKNIPYDSFETYFHDKHDKTLDEAVEDGSVDIPREIDEAAQIIRGNEGQFSNGRPNQNLARLLERRQIDPNDFRQSLRRHPFMEFRERVDSLAESAANQRRGEREQRETRRTDGRGERNRGSSRDTSEEAGFEALIERNLIEEPRFNQPPKSVDANDEDPDEKLKRLARIFEIRGYENPMHEALNFMGAQAEEMGVLTGDEDEHGWGESHWGAVRNEPSTVFTVPFQGGGQRDQGYYGGSKHAPKGSVESEYYGFRGPTPIVSSNRRPIEDKEADMDAVQDLMMTGEPMNVMDAAWGLLKGNRGMRDAEGKSIDHPAALKYANLSYTIDPYDAGPEGDIETRDINSALMAEKLRGSRRMVPGVFSRRAGKFLQKPMTAGKHYEEADREAAELTANTLEFGNEDDSPSPNYDIQRMPRPEEE